MATKRLANTSKSVTPLKRFKRMTSTDGSTHNSGVQRTSELSAPIVRLHGHQGEVFSCEFHPDGEILLSSGADRQIYIWSVFEKCERIMSLSGHRGGVMEAHFSRDGEHIFSCSTDHTVAVWDTFTGLRLRQLFGHTSTVNSVNSMARGLQMLCSGSDDRTVRIWDERRKEPVRTIKTSFQVTSTCFNKTGNQVIYAGMDNDIAVWDMRINEDLYRMRGHTNAITGLSLSPDGSSLLSNSMDCSLRIWNLSENCSAERCTKIFKGNQHSFDESLLRCGWSKDGSKIACGSSDFHIYIWDTATESMMYKLPGPKGIANDVDFHPKQPIIITATSDEIVYMGEIDNSK